MSTDRKDEKNKKRRGMNRRQFIQSFGVGTVIAATAGLSAEADAQAEKSEVIEAGDMIPVMLSVNGRHHRLLVEPRWSLLFVLRERLGLTGTKIGCDRGECGACTVLMNDVPRYACMTLAVEAEGYEITTVEGLLDGEALGPTQQAFLEHDAFQCGYCTSGQIMTAEGLVRQNSKPSPEEIRLAMSGNLCRCGTYTHITKAVRRAAELRGAK